MYLLTISFYERLRFESSSRCFFFFYNGCTAFWEHSLYWVSMVFVLPLAGAASVFFLFVEYYCERVKIGMWVCFSPEYPVYSEKASSAYGNDAKS